MLVEYSCRAKKVILFNERKKISFTTKDQRISKVTIHGPSEKDIKKNNGDRNFVICKIWGNFKTNPNVAECFQKISENKLPNNLKNLDEFNRFYENRSFEVQKLPRRYFPQPFQDYAASVHSIMSSFIRKTIDIYKWRCGLSGEHNDMYGGGMRFSFNGKQWFLIPHSYSIEFSGAAIINPPNAITHKIKKFLNDDIDQPLGHQLLREARSIQTTNPRGAMLIAVSALEVGVKECITKLSPKSTWLVENVPSPNTLVILNEYIPKLSTQVGVDKIFPLPKEINQTIKKGVTIRNNIAHLGKSAPKNTTINEIFSAINDILWLIDYCSGHHWASDHISQTNKDLIFNR